MDAEHYAGLSAAWVRVRDEPACALAIVTGAGERAFSAGADLKSFVGRRRELAELWLTQKDQLLNRGLEVWKPVIAAVNGYCVGGGMTLMLATDLRVAVTRRDFRPVRGQARHHRRERRHAAHHAAAALRHRAWRCCCRRARSTRETAARWGLVNRVVAREELMPTARDYARRIAANAPLAVQAAKELAVRSRDMPLADGLRMEQMRQPACCRPRRTRRKAPRPSPRSARRSSRGR